MADIEHLLDDIRKDKYCQEMRETFCNALIETNKAAEEMESTVKKIKDEIISVNATAEVIDARGGKETLGERLNDFDEQLDTNTKGSISPISFNEIDFIDTLKKSNNNKVVLRDKSYSISDFHNLNLDNLDKLHIVGEGKTEIKFQSVPDDYYIFISNVKNIIFENIDFYGNYDGTNGVFETIVFYIAGNPNDLDSSVKIKNCTFNNFNGTALFISKYKNVTYENCIFNNIYATGSFIKQSTNVTINNCKFTGRGMMGLQVGNSGVVVSQSEKVVIKSCYFENIEGTATKTEGCNDVIYDGNIVDTFSKDGIKIMAHYGSNTQECKNIVVSNNIIKNFIDTREDAGAYINVHCAKNVLISNNNILGTSNENYARAVINVNNWNGTTDGYRGNNIKVSGNVSSNTVCHAIKIQNQDDVIIEDNKLMGNVYMADVNNLTLNRNKITNVVNESTYKSYFIACNGQLLMIENIFKDSKIEIETDSSNWNISNNYIYGNITLNKILDTVLFNNYIECNIDDVPLNIYTCKSAIINKNIIKNGTYSIRLNVYNSDFIDICQNNFISVQRNPMILVSSTGDTKTVPVVKIENNSLYGYNTSSTNRTGFIYFSYNNCIINNFVVDDNIINKSNYTNNSEFNSLLQFNTGGAKAINKLYYKNNIADNGLLSQTKLQEIGNIISY